MKTAASAILTLTASATSAESKTEFLGGGVGSFGGGLGGGLGGLGGPGLLQGGGSLSGILGGGGYQQQQ